MIEKRYCTDANKLNRSINTTLILRMMKEGRIKGSGLTMLIYLIEIMNKNNRVRYKQVLEEYGLCRREIDKTLKALQDAYFIFKYKDGHIMVNPNVVCMTKYRNVMWYLRDIWNNKFCVWKNKSYLREKEKIDLTGVEFLDEPDNSLIEGENDE